MNSIRWFDRQIGLELGLYMVTLTILIMTSCQSNLRQTSLKVVNLSALEYTNTEVLLSNFAHKISYFPLETNDSSLISEIHDISFMDSTIAILDINLGYVLLFKSDGSFVRKLNQHVLKTGDRSKIHQLVYDKHTGQLLLYSKSRMVHWYLPDGNYLFSQRFDNLIPFYILPVEANLLLYFPYPRSIGFDNYDFGIANRSLKITNKLGYRKICWNPKDKDMVYFPNVYSLSDTLCFWNRYCDTVFGFIGNQLIPRFALTGSNLKSARGNYLQVHRPVTETDIMPYKIFETRDFIFVECVRMNSRCHLIIGKGNHLATEVKRDNSIDPYTILNDLDGGYPFWPNRATDNSMFMFVAADKLLKYFTSGNQVDGKGLLTKSLPTKLWNLKIQDNPVIFKLDLIQ